ncbi:SAM-dependent methyltransferase [Treponema sp.]|uniref:SAM-dependent methyltransferase n=1 Tax=Treponema sp. TaxID=166 RepID=UPI00298DF75B|nr:SAM-dependent methyltransferase [Treponema sp.]MCQ2242442.1 RsmB/NOP family class I SAM-dependent RNA methyltransferase [Treponema sp.]
MKNKNAKLSGSEGFDSFYSEIFKERWEQLKASLTPDNVHAEIFFEGRESYFLDPASVVSALCLPVKKSERIVDMCAAPGGKTLVLAGNLGEDALMFSNERSPQRKGRLAKVVQDSLPVEISERIKTSCSDATTWCRRESESYDSVLLDAPCSSERHVLNDPKYLDEWTPSRVKTISMEQWALLSCAFRLLKSGGHVLYSTCALCPQENDEIVRKLLKKFDNVYLASKSEMKAVFEENLSSYSGTIKAPEGYDFNEIFECAEETEFGLHVLPDTSKGAGPLYFCLIKKL